jgi:hypothetical protein
VLKKQLALKMALRSEPAPVPRSEFDGLKKQLEAFQKRFNSFEKTVVPRPDHNALCAKHNALRIKHNALSSEHNALCIK